MDGGALWATVHRVAKNRTQLSDFTFTVGHKVTLQYTDYVHLFSFFLLFELVLSCFFSFELFSRDFLNIFQMCHSTSSKSLPISNPSFVSQLGLSVLVLLYESSLSRPYAKLSFRDSYLPLS